MFPQLPFLVLTYWKLADGIKPANIKKFLLKKFLGDPWVLDAVKDHTYLPNKTKAEVLFRTILKLATFRTFNYFHDGAKRMVLSIVMPPLSIDPTHAAVLQRHFMDSPGFSFDVGFGGTAVPWNGLKGDLMSCLAYGPAESEVSISSFREVGSFRMHSTWRAKQDMRSPLGPFHGTAVLQNPTSNEKPGNSMKVSLERCILKVRKVANLRMVRKRTSAGLVREVGVVFCSVKDPGVTKEFFGEEFLDVGRLDTISQLPVEREMLTEFHEHGREEKVHRDSCTLAIAHKGAGSADEDECSEGVQGVAEGMQKRQY
ncbi:hypothetical protein B0H11DRAFT_1899813 [Mycena galericulata]|nr:hypothetical protein B0H11DRAFT_1899813 [Mycena galericulata]